MTVLATTTATAPTAASPTPSTATLITRAADPIPLVICDCGTAAFADEADDLGARNPDTAKWVCGDCLVTCGTCSLAVSEDKADAHGFVSDPDTGEWQCEDCRYAPASPRLVGMVPC